MEEKRITEYVNPFLGCDPIDLGKPFGVGKRWRAIKGLVGNSHPGSMVPFGKMSCVAFSGSYPTGYGNCRVNSCGKVRKLTKNQLFYGFTHLQQSGTGYICYFYNYALLSVTDANRPLDVRPYTVRTENEFAEPGYYRLKTEDFLAESTATKDSAFYRFTAEKEIALKMDFSHYGILSKNPKDDFHAEMLVCTKVTDEKAVCTVCFHGRKVFFAVYVPKGKVRLFEKNALTNGTSARDIHGECGALFTVPTREAYATVTLSYLSEEDALRKLNRDTEDVFSPSERFERIKKRASDLWEDALGRIRVQGTEAQKIIFYSNLYHTLVKPCDVSGEKVYGFDGDCVVDLATMWDMYKTQLPLLMTTYPETGRKVLRMFIGYGKTNGLLLNSFLLGDDVCADQAQMLAHYTVCDGVLRGVITPEEAYPLIIGEWNHPKYKDFVDGKTTFRTTHLMDIYEAGRADALVLERVTDENLRPKALETAAKLRALYGNIEKVFDKKTGMLLKNQPYYEGNYINYSFRFFADPELRVKCAGGKERYARLLDAFFGIYEKRAYKNLAEKLRFLKLTFQKSGKFEGFNNEPDMETPYAYHDCGRHDRIADIVQYAMNNRWQNTRGGMPGNNDSGALSSCFVWNAIGIFPVAGQDKMIVGSPWFSESTLAVGDKTLTVRKHTESIYIQKAVLNGKECKNLEFSVQELTQGGVLDLY